jgi:hypothetical protein
MFEVCVGVASIARGVAAVAMMILALTDRRKRSDQEPK